MCYYFEVETRVTLTVEADSPEDAEHVAALAMERVFNDNRVQAIALKRESWSAVEVDTGFVTTEPEAP